MTRHANIWFQCVLAVAGIVLATTAPLAAERAGGLRQTPLTPPGGMKSGNGSAPVTSRPGPMDPSVPQPAKVPQPPESAVITYRGAHYVVSEGRWFERRGNKLLAISPPEGVLVQELPQGYSMRWVGGVPYFHADGLYYVWRERKRSYEILSAPPPGESEQRSDAPPRLPDSASQERAQIP